MATSKSTSNESVVYEAPCFLRDTDLVPVWRVAPFAPIAFFALTGNPLVLAVVWRKKTMRKIINFFIANMALSDLIFTLVYIPRVVTILALGYKWLVHGYAGLIFCHTLYGIITCWNNSHRFRPNDSCNKRGTFFGRDFPVTSVRNDKNLRVRCLRIVADRDKCVKIPTLFASSLADFQDKTYCLVDFDVTFGSGSGQVYFKFVFIAEGRKGGFSWTVNAYF